MLVLQHFLSRFGLDLSWGCSGERAVIHTGFSQSHPASPVAFCWNDAATIEACFSVSFITRGTSGLRQKQERLEGAWWWSLSLEL